MVPEKSYEFEWKCHHLISGDKYELICVKTNQTKKNLLRKFLGIMIDRDLIFDD